MRRRQGHKNLNKAEPLFYYVATKSLNFKAYPDEQVRFWEMSWK